MISSSVIYNHAKLRSSAMCNAGEDFISQRIDWQTRYTFSAKEKDKNTGYHYFGARYYDSEVSVWLSVDPRSSWYPDQSPYSYVGNRPINVIDPNGMNEWIPPSDGSDGWTAEPGDGAETLSKDAGISREKAYRIMKEQGHGTYKDNDGVIKSDVDPGDVVHVPTDDQASSTGTSGKNTSSENNQLPSNGGGIETTPSGPPTYKAEVLLYAGTAAAADGPLPVGEAIGASIIFGYSIYWLVDYSIYRINMDDTHTGRGNPTNWDNDPEIRRLKNDRYYPPGGKPPWWLWIPAGAAAAKELYDNYPKPEIKRPQPPGHPVDNTHVAPY